MIVITDSLIINTEHLLWMRRDKEDRWIVNMRGTGLSTTNITEAEAQAFKAEMARQMAPRVLPGGTPNATDSPPVKRPPGRPPATRP